MGDMDLNNGSKEEIDKKWEQAARELLQLFDSKKYLTSPEPVVVLIMWNRSTYIGSIQVIVPEFSKEIVVVSKSSKPLPFKLAEAIRKLYPEMLELNAYYMLDMTGRQHILRRSGERLTRMTPEQTEYMLLHPPVITEI